MDDFVTQALAAYPRESVAGQAAWIVTFQPHQQIGGIPGYRAWIVMLKPDLFLISLDRNFLDIAPNPALPASSCALTSICLLPDPSGIVEKAIVERQLQFVLEVVRLWDNLKVYEWASEE